MRENLDTLEGRSKINMMLAEEVGRQALGDPKVIERAKARFLGDLYSKQENVEAVVGKAAEHIDQAGTADEPSSDEMVADDWMNTFIRHAENATSDDLRDRLAKVLAGETQKPGSYSRGTVRVIAEMSEKTVRHFQAVRSSQISQWIFTGEDWNSGLYFEIGTHLESEGLITGSQGFTHVTVGLGANGEGMVLGKEWSLVFEGPPNAKKQFGCWMLTEVGREVAGLLPAVNEAVACRNVANLIKKDDLKSVHLGQRVEAIPRGSFVRKAGLLWSAQ